MRSMAEEEEGDQCDSRELHEMILVNGAMPREILEEYVTYWISAVGPSRTINNQIKKPAREGCLACAG